VGCGDVTPARHADHRKRKVKSYPVRGGEGTLFVFVGDDDFCAGSEPDAPPMPLDEDM
jgi:hypothetical protein